jgi:DNA-binding transcriptional regulator YhcF (GntR family)
MSTPVVRVVLDRRSGAAPYEQVRSQIASAIDRGELRPADRLPPVRTLAAELGLAINTVARSYRDLEHQGLVTTRGRHGTFVAGQTPVAREQAGQEAARFIVRMRELGISEVEMLAILRREGARIADPGEPADGALPSADEPEPDLPSA